MDAKTNKKVFSKSLAAAIGLVLIMCSLIGVLAYLTAKDSATNNLSVKNDPDVYIQWEDFIPGDEVVTEVNKKAWNNTVINVTFKDGNTTEILAYSANDLTANPNHPYAYIMQGAYSEEDLNKWMVGSEIKLVGSFQHDCSGQRIKSIKLAKNPDPQVSGGKTYVKYEIELGYPITSIPKSGLNNLVEYQPFQPEREGKTFLGWTKVELDHIDPITGDEYYRTVADYLAVEADKEVTVLWRDGQATGDISLFNRAAWNKGELKITHTDNTSEIYSTAGIGNDGTVQSPQAWAYLPSQYKEEFWQTKLIGSEATFKNTLVPINSGYIKDITLTDLTLPGNTTKGADGKTYYKYNIHLTMWPETVINAKYLSNLREVSPYQPYREGYHFDGWSKPVELKTDYFVTYAQWTKISEDPDDLTLPSYAAKYGNILVFGRGTVPNNYQGVPLDKSWSDIEDLGGNIPWKSYAKDIKEVDVVGRIQPVSTESWFDGFENMKIMNFSKLDFQNTTNMSRMFVGCGELLTLDMSSAYKEKVTHTTSMFEGCSKLTRVYVDENWNNTYLQEHANMFKGCSSIVGQNGYRYDPTSLDGTFAVIDSDMSPGYFTQKMPEAYAAIYSKPDGSDKRIVFGRGSEIPLEYGSYTDSNKNTQSYKLYDSYRGIETDTYEEYTVPWKKHANDIVDVDFIAQIQPVSTAYWFKNFSNIKTIDLNGLDTQYTIDMRNTFANCTRLTAIDLSGLDTSNVKYFGGLFYFCESLNYFNWSKNDTSSAIGMGTMFWECKNLKNVTFGPKFNTSNVVRMNGMFYGCVSLTQLDLSSFDTSNVEQINSIFQNCTNLKTVYAGPNFVTSAVDWKDGNKFVNMAASTSNIIGGLGTKFNQEFASDLRILRVDKSVTGGYFGSNLSVQGYFTPKINVVYHDLSGNVSKTVAYKYGVKAMDLGVDGFVGWSLDGDSNVRFKAGQNVVYDINNPFEDINLYPVVSDVSRQITFDANGGLFTDTATNIVSYSKSLIELNSVVHHTKGYDDLGNTTVLPGYDNGLYENTPVTIDGADVMKVSGKYSTAADDWLAIYDSTVTPSRTNYASSVSGKLTGISEFSNIEILGSTAQLYFTSDSSGNNAYGYWAKVTGYKYGDYVVSDGEYVEPTKDGYTFLGWSSDISATSPEYTSVDDIPVDNKTYYAVWEEVIIPGPHTVSDLMKDMTLKEKVCQMFNVYTDDLITGNTSGGQSTVSLSADQINNLQSYPFGGVTYFYSASSGNIKTESQAKSLSAQFQSSSEIPMFISVDEEGGRVQRIGGTTYDNARRGAGIGTQVNAMYTYKDQGVNIAYNNAVALANNCKLIGCNWDFAPVADIWSNPANTTPGARCYSDSFTGGAELVASAVKGFKDTGVGCTIKHFPGHGNTSADSHYSTPIVDKTLDELWSEEFVPFKAGVDVGVDSVMFGHLMLPAVDTNKVSPASPIVMDIVRKDMGFNGVITTDGMRMGAMTKIYGTTKQGYINAVLDCLNAGMDVFLLAGYPKDCVDTIVTKVESGEISESRIDESVERILTMKNNLGLLDDILVK